MSTQNILWTALPAGLNANGDRLILSVLVSPRLTPDGGVDGTLGQFDDFLDWPATVAKLKFHVEIQGGPTFDLQPVVLPGFPALDSEAWQALYRRDSTVHPYAFDDRAGIPVRSFPTKKILSFIKTEYQHTAITSAAAKPGLTELGLTRNSQRLGLAEIALNSDFEPGVRIQIEDTLKHNAFVGRNFGGPRHDFYQVKLMHDFLSKKIRNKDGHLEFLPPQKPTDVDFHKAVAAMGQYPQLLRALGLVIDLEIPSLTIAPSSNVRVRPSLPAAAQLTPWTAYHFDSGKKQFFAASGPGSDVSTGMLFIGSADDYDVVEMDVDGAARKVQDFASNGARIGLGEVGTSIDTPKTYGLPSLRSAGFSVARADRAKQFVDTFNAARANQTAIVANPGNSAVTFHAADLTRGYRIDVWSSLSKQWHSLCRRDGDYRFERAGLTRQFADEGFVTFASTQSADGTSTDMRITESLFRWAGWSLCARRPGNTVGEDSHAQPVANDPITEFKLQTSFKAAKGSLPRLRFGALYKFRARAADLAGNSIAPDAALDDIYNLPPQGIPYLRYEPIAAPVLVYRQQLDPLVSPGESLERIVIRSNFDTNIASVAERHIAPPKTSVEMAETHGMLDTSAGPPDKALYATLANKDGSFDIDPDHPEKPVAHPEAQLKLPYLPDPFASGAAFVMLPGMPAGHVWKQPFTGVWPDTKPFRFAVDEGSAPPSFVETVAERVLTVHLPKAEIATVALSCNLSDSPSTSPASMLSTMKIWSWITEASPPNLNELRKLAFDGGHWMLTPPRTLTLVHAVQQPLIEPQFQDPEVTKTLGQTSVRFTDEIPISGKSTIKVDIEAKWQEPIDDLSNQAQPIILNGKTHAFEVQLNDPAVTVTALTGNHEFHDTKHRVVEYRAVATTRFKEYFPDALTADPVNITRTSESVTLSVLNSARPAAPKVLYVVPTFGWEEKAEGAWNFSRRSGGGLRVYLDRPWFSSGEGELLGAVLRGCQAPEPVFLQVVNTPATSTAKLAQGYYTQWGMDPIWQAPSTPFDAVPERAHFLNCHTFGDALTLDEMNGRQVTFSVAGHTVAFDTVRQLWYCDIQMDPGDAYFPFVRLALARYQPASVADAHLSRVVLADFIQLMPDRSASLTFDPIETTKINVAITGRTYAGPGEARVLAILQTQPVGGGDAAWMPIEATKLTPSKLGGAATLWSAEITLPDPRGTRPFRLVIEEFETFATQFDGGPKQNRLVYADVLNI